MQRGDDMWRSVKDDPPIEEEVCWIAVPDWMNGDQKSYLVLLVYSIYSGGTWKFFQGPGDAAQGFELRPEYWMPMSDWPLPPAPEGDA